VNKSYQNKILIIDDNELNRDMLARRLERHGYMAITAENGKFGIDLIKKNNFDLVLLDIMMPDINGLEILKFLRKHFSTIQLPIIMVTARSDSEDIVQALELGANDYISKPIDFPVALARIKTQVEMKNMEKELKKSSENFKDLFDNSSDLIQSISPDGKFLYVNKSWIDTLGYTKEDIETLSIFDIIDAECKDECSTIFRDILIGKNKKNTIETNFITKDLRVIGVNGQISSRYEDGVLVSIRCILKDITEKRKSEIEIKEKNQILNSLLKNIPIIVYRLDKNGFILQAVGTGLERLGKDDNQSVGMKLADIYPISLNYVQTALSGGSTKFISDFNINGSKVYFQNYIFFDSAKNQGAIGVSIDITDRKIIEELLEKARNEAIIANRAKSDFLASMSHEIRTPMNSVIGMTQLLFDTELSTEQKELTKSIKINGDFLLSVINDILDFSKIESGKMEIENKPLNLRKCIEEIFDFSSSKITEKELNLLYFIEPDVPSNIRGDITRLRQILVNLINNSIKFTNQKGQIYINISKKYQNEDKTELLFSIRDTGIGISREQASKIFQPFSQADSSTTRKYGGTGLGLSICSKLVKMMGGDLWLESQLGQGATFYFTIETEVINSLTKENTNKQISELENKRILLISDNETVLNIFNKQIVQWGSILVSEPVFDTALENIKNNNFDALIFDLDNKNINIFNMLARIKEINDKIPIITLMFLGKKYKSLELIKENIYGYINKPIKLTQLQNVLLSIFTKKIETCTSFETRTQLDRELGNKLPLRILLTEDNEANQNLAFRIFKKMGYDIDIANNGVEAIKALEENNYDIIFMDIQMPEMDGFETTKNIIELYNSARPKIIAMTANALDGDREKCINIGMDDYISKPISVQELQDKIKFWGYLITRSVKTLS